MNLKSKLGGFSIDCRTDDLQSATRFWAEALGARVLHDNSNFQALEEQSGLSCELQAVDHHTVCNSILRSKNNDCPRSAQGGCEKSGIGS